jgi:hypothetical protein
MEEIIGIKEYKPSAVDDWPLRESRAFSLSVILFLNSANVQTQYALVGLAMCFQAMIISAGKYYPL